MINNKKSIDYLITLLVFALLVFHTCTFLQIYYNFTVTISLFMIIVRLNMTKRNRKIKIGDISTLIFLFFTVVLIIFIGLSVKGFSLVEMVGAYFPYIIWIVLYHIMIPLLSEKEKRKFLIAYLIFFAISVIATLSVVYSDNDAARLLAGAATGSERYIYYKKGVGGYGFIYGCVFLIFGLIVWRKKEKNKILRTILLILTIVTSIMIIYASYTTALLMVLIILFLNMYTSSKSKMATVLFIFSIFILIFLINPIFEILYNIADSLDLYWISNRVGQLINLENSGNVNELTRTQLYMVSLNAFFDNILIGGNKVGGHSMFFDHLGRYGLFGGMFFIAYCLIINKMRKAAIHREGLIYLLFIALMFINTSDTIVLLPLCLFILPMILSLRNVK